MNLYGSKALGKSKVKNIFLDSSLVCKVHLSEMGNRVGKENKIKMQNYKGKEEDEILGAERKNEEKKIGDLGLSLTKKMMVAAD